MRWNLVVSLLLGFGIVVLGNLLAGRHLRVRADLSADGLNSMSSATRRIVERIEDRVTVRLFATESVEDGQLALRTARIRGQLDEILQLRPDAFELQTLDPSRSSEAQRNASDVGFTPMRSRGAALEGGGGTPVWLSLELSYRGRTERVPVPRPFEFETQFASALHSLLADRKPGVGWVGPPIVRPPLPAGTDETRLQIDRARPSYRGLRLALERRAHFEVLSGLATGRAVPDNIDVVFVVSPAGLPERTVYELGRFVQGGGRLIVCVGDPSYNVLLGSAEFESADWDTSPMAALLKSFGCKLAIKKQIWDGQWQSERRALVFDRNPPAMVRVRSPAIVTVPDEGLSDEVAPTRGVTAARFYWAHPLVPTALWAPPDTVRREDLVWSSEDGRLDEILPQLSAEPSDLRNRMSYLRQKPGARHVIGASFSGFFPTPWDDGEPPPVLGLDGRPSSSQPAARPVDEAARGTGQVVVFGDSDWLRDPWEVQGKMLVPFTAAGGLVLAQNLVDWLTLDEELIGLRSRAPTPRPLRDFLTEEMKDAGVFDRDPYETKSEQLERDRKSDAARGRARLKQWLTMLLPALGALGVLALFGFVWNFLQRPRASRQGEVNP